MSRDLLVHRITFWNLILKEKMAPIQWNENCCIWQKWTVASRFTSRLRGPLNGLIFLILKFFNIQYIKKQVNTQEIVLQSIFKIWVCKHCNKMGQLTLHRVKLEHVESNSGSK